MKYYKGLYGGTLHNVGFFGGWRCGAITIDGHYSYVTDLKEFVFWKFGTYANLTSITEDYQEPVLSEIEIHYANDVILEQIRRDMYNKTNPNLTDIADKLWDGIYGDTRIEMKKQWKNLKHYPFSKSNVSLNIHSGDWVRNSQTGEEFMVNYQHNVEYINKCEDYVLIPEKRYSEFPDLSVMRTKTKT